MNEVSSTAERIVFEFANAPGPYDWALPTGLCLSVIAFCTWWTWRDCVEIGRGWAILFSTLRAIACFAVLVFYLQPQWRAETKIVQPSRVAVLVDTSQSMGLADSAGDRRRIDFAADFLEASPLLGELQTKQEVDLYSFDQELRPLALPESPRSPGAAANTPPGDEESAVLALQGATTQLGDALRDALVRESNETLAGVIVLSDGQSNAGATVDAAAALAAERGVRVFTLGFGATERPRGVRIVAVEAPPRVFPGDAFPIKVHLQGSGGSGETVEVRLASSAVDAETPPRPEASERVELGGEGETTIASIEVPGRDETGTRRYEVEAIVVGNSSLSAASSVDVEIVDRKTQVLLIAGGPTREYQFLRNQLHRDREFEVDVWLQKAASGISQDARNLLSQFPSTAEELFAYDAIVCFDVDWRETTEENLSLLERWVAEQAGGLVFLAGPIYMDRWLYDDRYRLLRDLHPVVFQRRFTQFIDARYGFEEPHSLELTREGGETDFLRLSDSESAPTLWRKFDGVYGFFDVNDAKPGATVLLRCLDPHAFGDDGGPIFLAEQFYGAGRTEFLASGEMWRLRKLDPDYFETFYTNLLRHVSAGRLLRGSQRGSLFTDKERYLLGDSVVVRARLLDRRLEPLETESVALQLVEPSGGRMVMLRPVDERPGFFEGRFNVTREGTYELLFDVPDSDGERLTRRLEVRAPEIERRRPERNVEALQSLAERTGGRYYASPSEAAGGAEASLAALLPDMTRESYLAGAVDEERERTLRTWLLAAFCTALCLEWLIRRMKRLA